MRPDFIKHYTEIQEPDSSYYPGSKELHGLGSPFGRTFGLKRLGIHHEVLPPGRRTSWPHAEKTEEEFVYVIEGTPDAWINGTIYRLQPGDAVGFPPGTGIAHTFINNTESDIRLMVVGDANRPDNQINYPMHAEYNQKIGSRHWSDAPKQKMGVHDGLPDKLRR
ncbi:cupin domain-containing protein [bacterium]|nr:cupin domain-containing protein [bacterium]